VDRLLRKHKWFVILIAVVLVVLAGASLGSAQSDEPITLQPSFILMDEFKGGEIRRGVVYAFDGGWILADGDNLVYTYGCRKCGEITEECNE